jgi:tetratricopeptide (TPR) repeat protein
MLASNRNWVNALHALAQCKLFTGSIDETIPLEEQAIRLSPRDPGLGNWYGGIGLVHLLQSRTDEAIVWFEKSRNFNPVKPLTRAYLAAAYALKLYLDMRDEWNLPGLDGIATAPLLAEDGGIRTVEGYDPASRLWCCRVPGLAVPERAGRQDAEAALRLLRATVRTFPFADAVMVDDKTLGVDVVDPAAKICPL